MISQLLIHLSRLKAYQQRFGWRLTAHRLLSALIGPPALATAPPPPPSAESPPPPSLPPSPETHPPARQTLLTPLHVFHTPARGRKRITLVVDRLAAPQPMEPLHSSGVLWALGGLLARRCGADLRCVTRLAPADPALLLPLLQADGAAMRGEIQCQYLPAHDAKTELDLIDGELLITDAWQNTAAALAAVEPARVIYVLQTDERRDGVDDDERQRFDAVLGQRGLRCVILTAALTQQMAASGHPHLAAQALSFEPPPAHAGPGAWPAALNAVLDRLATEV